jgi:hypothetical protein
MKTTIKFAALGAVALAATSTAALAGSQTPGGLTAGLPLAAPLPVGVYDLSIGLVQQNNPNGGLEAALPVWLIWSTPYQIAGGRIQLDGTMPWANVDGAAGPDGFQNGLTNASIHWNLGNGLNFDESVGVYWAGSGSGLADPKSRFLGHTDVAYIAGGWALSANFIYGSSDSSVGAPSYLNVDLAAVRKFGKFEAGVVAYSTTDLQNGNNIGAGAACAKACEQSQFAVGGLVGYDFGSFSGNFKLTQVVSESNYDYAPGQGYKNTTAWLTIVKPLWNPASEGPLK